MPGFMGDVKQIASNVWRKSREGVDKLAANIDERTEIAKLNAKVNRLNKERGEIMAEMGRKVYALHRRGAIRNKDLLGDCNRVDEIATAVDQLRVQIEELRKKKPEEPEVPEVVDVTPVEDLPDEPEVAAEEPVPAEAAQPEPDAFDESEASAGDDAEDAPEDTDPQ